MSNDTLADEEEENWPDSNVDEPFVSEFGVLNALVSPLE